MEKLALKKCKQCLNTNIYSCLETSGGQNSNLYLNVIHFFQHMCELDICGSLKLLFSCIGVLYTVFYCLNTNIYSYFETSGGQSSNLYLNVIHFFQHLC